jgi:ComF family protein
MNFFKKISEIIFPSHCLYCEKIIGTEGLFCNDCWQKLQFITEPKCQFCCHPFEFSPAGENLICASCLADPRPQKIISIFRYNDVIKKIIGDFKYRDQTHIAKKLVRFFLIHAKKEIAESDFIVAVPLHKNKLRKRKFNQSLLLARAISKTKLQPDFLLRIKDTSAQVSLQKKQRENNLKNAFVLNSKYLAMIKNKNILLIDDVITTGTTVKNCAEVLTKSGAKNVTILTIAKTVFN